MAKWIFFFCLACAVVTEACAQAALSASRVVKPIVVDGQANEWDDAEMQFEPKASLKYNFANDGKYLYVCLQTSDELAQIKIIHGGLQLWIDSTGRKKKQVSLQFPLPSKEPLFDRKLRKPTENDDVESAANQLNLMGIYQRNADNWREMQLSGFYAPLAGLQPLTAKGAPQVKVAWSRGGILVYEAAIPLASCCATVLAAKEPTVAVGFRINGFDLPRNMPSNNSQSVTNPMAGMGGGMGRPGMMGGMGGGGMMMGPMPGPSAASTNVEVWTKVRLNK
jgi:hypothetical protein